MDISKMTKEERRQALAELQQLEKADAQERREAYEGLRKDFMESAFAQLDEVVKVVTKFRDKLDKESEAFYAVMRDYGKLPRGDGQRSFTITQGDLKMEVSNNMVKSFDDRAELAAERLINYLKEYVGKTEKGMEDPIYQLCMTLLERNRQGKLDYKSISKLYSLEDKFDAEYADIMQLFKESNIVLATATNYYFSRRDPQTGVWRRIEPSFCRL
jgi:hypothetical protein